MKAGTQNHLKTKRLMRLLGIPLYRAVGILETMWLLCSDCCDDGAIGKYSDEEICDYIGWDGPNPSQLVQALSASGWIDADDDARFVVHDWKDHCPKYIAERIRKRAQRDKKSRITRTSVQPVPDKSPESRDKPPSVPSIPNPTKPNPTNSNHPQTPTNPDGLAGGWDVDSVATARLALTTCGFKRFDVLLAECRERGQNPGDIVDACRQYRANTGKLSSPGSISEFLRTGVWPANGVVATGSAPTATSAEKLHHQIEALRVRLIKEAKVDEAREWSHAKVLEAAKSQGWIA